MVMDNSKQFFSSPFPPSPMQKLSVMCMDRNNGRGEPPAPTNRKNANKKVYVQVRCGSIIFVVIISLLAFLLHEQWF